MDGPDAAKPKSLDDEASRSIRITLTSLNVEALEKVCADQERGAVDRKLRVAVCVCARARSSRW